MRIRDPVDFLTTVFGIRDRFFPDPGSQTYILIFWEFNDNFWVRSSIILSNGRKFFLYQFNPKFFGSVKNHQIKIKLILNWWRKNLDQITKICRTFLPKKFSLKSQKYGFGSWDPESEIRDPEKKPIPDPGVKKAPGSRIHIRNTGIAYQ